METRCYQLGIVGLRLSSESAAPLDDYDALYEAFRVQAVCAPALEIAVCSRRLRPWSRCVYTVRCAGREKVVGRKRRTVLPEIEAALTRQVQGSPRLVQLPAGALSRDGQALLLASAEGRSVSALAAGMLSRGWQLLSAEPALIDPGARRAQPFPRALQLARDELRGIRRLGLGEHVAGPFELRGGQRCYYLPAWKTDGHARAVSAPVRWWVSVASKDLCGARPDGLPAAGCSSELMDGCLRLHVGLDSIEATVERIDQSLSQAAPPPGVCAPSEAPADRPVRRVAGSPPKPPSTPPFPGILESLWGRG
jgi:hypothetical protein